MSSSGTGQCRSAAGFVLVRISPSKKLEYLLLQMKYDRSNWGPPKGHLNSNETYLEGAERETREETGLLPQHYEILTECEMTLNYMARGRPKTVKLWPALLKDFDTPIQMSDEHSDMKWVPFSEADELICGVEMKKQFVICDAFCSSKFNS